MRIYFLIALCCFLSGCVATVQNIYTAEGDEGFIIDCSGSGLTWGECYKKAGEICGDKGYFILEKNSDDDAKAYADQFGYYRSTVTVNRDLIIKCKD
jgi:hypothetical protein